MAIGSATSPTGGTVSCWRIVAAARPAQVATICDLVPSYVTPEPEHSVLLLADFSNAQLPHGPQPVNLRHHALGNCDHVCDTRIKGRRWPAIRVREIVRPG